MNKEETIGYTRRYHSFEFSEISENEREYKVDVLYNTVYNCMGATIYCKISTTCIRMCVFPLPP